MRKRGFSTSVALTATATLALTSVGTATAAGITAQDVKRIATNVVLTKAHTLHVAKADDARQLAGRPPSAYQNQSYVTTTDVAPGTATVTIPITPPAGQYLIDYSAFLALEHDPGTQVDCYLQRQEGDELTFFGESSFWTEATTGGASGSGLSDVGGDVTLSLTCTATDTFSTYDTEPIQVVATRVDNVSTSRVDPAASPQTKLHQR